MRDHIGVWILGHFGLISLITVMEDVLDSPWGENSLLALHF
jgi:hypothetical protein